MARKKTIVICWIESDSTDEVRTLAYHNGKGDVRTYPQDQYDPRTDMAQAAHDGLLPFFDKAGDAVEWMSKNRRGVAEVWACQLHLGAARKLLKGVGFADPEAYERLPEPDALAAEAF